MCAILHEEVFGCLSSMGTLSREQKWPILSRSCVCDPLRAIGINVKERNFDLEDHDEFA
jgi:hypothetical protein